MIVCPTGTGSVTAMDLTLTRPTTLSKPGHSVWNAAGVHVTLPSLTQISNQARDPNAGDRGHPARERYEPAIVEILRRLSRRPIDPTPDSELLADLGFDSLQVLELVGELEDHFNIAIPLNSLTHIRTVSQITAEVSRLVDRGNERGHRSLPA
jgi:acyl carrier protein